MMLLLGCVVMCEGKGPLIEKMKGMELTQQHALVAHIQQVGTTVCVLFGGMLFMFMPYIVNYVVACLFVVHLMSYPLDH